MIRTPAMLFSVALLVSACGDDDGQGNTNDNTNGNDTSSCGNGEVEGAEQCDDGVANSDSTPDACRTSCVEAFCGDGVLDASELCDDGPANSSEVPDACRPVCTLPECGDAVVDVRSGESCDDGNLEDGDGCNHHCAVEFCGNGSLDPGEQCDDGNLAPGDGCGPTCREETCGNGFYDPGEACEDGNVASRDGCSSGCTRERPQWEAGITWVPPRAKPTVAHHTAAGQLVLFGGFNGGDLDDTWAFDGTHWTRLRPGIHPEARAHSAMVYDSLRKRLVLFGGRFSTMEDLADTWVFDGTNWTRLTTAHAPPRRALHAMAYDSVRDRVVLFGGDEQLTGRKLDTWEFDGNDWIEITTAAVPPARREHAMAYDAVNQRVVMFGGINTASHGDLWSFDGTNWSPITATGDLPAARWGSRMAYDPNRQVVVLVGGSGFSDTYELDGTQWTVKAPLWSPGGNDLHLAYHGVLGEVVLWGGSGNAIAGEMHRFAGTAWQAISPPSALTGSAGRFAQHEASGRGVLLRKSGATAETWVLENGVWTDLTGVAAAPTGRQDFSMAYDAQREVVVIYGGYDPGGNVAETWEFDGADWTENITAHNPGVRRQAAMVFDGLRGVVVLFGGDSLDQPQNSTWEFDGTDWTEITTANAPPARYRHAMAYDAERNRTVVFGGFAPIPDSLFNYQYGDTWEYDGTDWSRSWTAVNPPPRQRTALAYHPGIRRLVMYGGYKLDTNTTYYDTWEYDGVNWLLMAPGGITPVGFRPVDFTWDPRRRHLALLDSLNGLAYYHYAGSWSDEHCANSADDDEDGRTDCDDPDCDGQPCGPGQTCQAGVCL